MSDHHDPVPLAESLERYFRLLGAPPVSVITQLGDRWGELVGPATAANTRPTEVRDGTLVVGCDDAAWAAQIGWMERQIIDRLQAAFGDVNVTRVVARTGR